jgi:hypothetical protein
MIRIRRPRLCVLLAGAAAGAAPGSAAGQVRLEPQSQPPAGERPSGVGPAYTPRGPGGARDYQAQVNVNAQGQNIIGDAANEPSLAVDPTAPNRIAVGWRQFDSITSNFRQAGRAYSRDGGRTWTNPGPLDPGVFRSDPVLRPDPDGRVFYSSLTNVPNYNTSLFVSADGGATFPAVYPSYGDDKQWIAVDDTAGASRGFIYQSWSRIQGDNNFTRSLDHGVTWMPPVPVVPVWGTIAVGPSGQVYIAGVEFPTTNPGPIRVARSLNASNPAVTPTFTTVTATLGGSLRYGAPPNPAGLAGTVQIAVDRSGGPRNGWVYILASVDRGGTDPLDVMFNRSTDGGQTWLSTPIRVNNGPLGTWEWFGTMSVAPGGRIDAIWNDTRESGVPTLSRLYYAWSTDGGTTWQGNTPLGPQWNAAAGYPQQDKIGDYYDMHSDDVGAFVIYAATYTGGQDVYFLRIGDWDCNRNGVPDSQDLATGALHDCNGNGIPDECELAAGVPVVCPCYANCDGSAQPPVLNVLDFNCFLNKFAAGDSYANCDQSTTPPVLNILDFSCFLNRFAAGCP